MAGYGAAVNDVLTALYCQGFVCPDCQGRNEEGGGVEIAMPKGK
jgi:hypothetical protein